MAAKNGGENYFREKLPLASADTLGVNHFIKIALSPTVYEINAFLCFTQKFKMANKYGGKSIFEVPSRLSLGIKNFVEIALSHTVSEINAFLDFTKNSRWQPKWRENDSGKKSPVDSAHTVRVKHFVETAPFLR